MRFNFRLYFKLLYRSLFRTKGTHARLTPKRIKSLFFWFLIIPVHNLFTWIGFGLDEIFLPDSTILVLRGDSYQGFFSIPKTTRSEVLS